MIHALRQATIVESANKYRFTLIHGTFSAGTGWVNHDENQRPEGFRARLKSAMEMKAEFRVPEPWGATSRFAKLSDLTNTARLAGAETLKRDILDAEQGEDEKHFLLAHSHGGNIAMYAMQDPQVRDRIDGVICMATPFLFPRPRPLSISALLLALIIMAAGVINVVRTVEWQGGFVTWASIVGMVIVSIVVPAFLVWIVAKERYQRRVFGDPKLQEHIARLSYSDPRVPILLIRASGDEASGLLRASQFLNWLAGIVMRVGGRQLYFFLGLTGLCILWMAYAGFSWIPNGALAILATALMVLAGIIVVSLMILTISRILVGLDAWRWVGELETMIEDGPPGIKSELVVITPRQPQNGLAHTEVYNMQETIDAIATWCIQERL